VHIYSRADKTNQFNQILLAVIEMEDYTKRNVSTKYWSIQRTI